MNEPDNDGKNEPKGKLWWFLGFALVFLVGMLLLVLPTLSQTHGTPYSVRCATNMHSIGLGFALYRCDHNDLPPPNLAALVADDLASAEVLVCPRSGTEKAATTQPADIESHCDYIYAPLPNEAKILPMIFELPRNHRQRVVNVLFNDCHVKGIRKMDRFVSLVQELNDYHAGLRRAKP